MWYALALNTSAALVCGMKFRQRGMMTRPFSIRSAQLPSTHSAVAQCQPCLIASLCTFLISERLHLPFLLVAMPSVLFSPETGVFCLCLTEFYLRFKSPPRVSPLGRLLHHSWKLSPCFSGPLWFVYSSSLPSDHTAPLILVCSSVCCNQGTLSGSGHW